MTIKATEYRKQDYAENANAHNAPYTNYAKDTTKNA